LEIGNVNLLISPTYLIGGAGVIDALPMARHRSVLSRRNANKQKTRSPAGAGIANRPLVFLGIFF